MKIQQLSRSFQNEISSLTEVLHDKNRGYGVVTIIVNDLTFAIPLRTRVTHKNAFITDKVKRNGEICSRGLDYQKAILIKDEESDLAGTYKVEKEQLAVINEGEGKIRKNFDRYVKNYIRGVNRGDQRILCGYKFSTLQNYHSELNI